MNITPIITRTKTSNDILKLAKIVKLHLRTCKNCELVFTNERHQGFWTRNKRLLGNCLVVLAPLNKEIKGK